LDNDVADACSTLITIRGSDRVESLNVAATAAILLWETSQSRRDKARVETTGFKPIPRPDRPTR
jgi:tRNA C32,U32 (ribose-2'-O)-methylase TrmJ